MVSGPCAKAASAPGVSAHKIVTGMILTRTGSLAADFDPLQYGEEAYFKLVNSQGGVNGRKIDLAYVLDDGGNPSQFASLAHALVDQDHVFAVTGVASVFFTPNFLAATCTPTYGYTTENNWGGPPNFFGAGGSVIVDQDDGRPFSYIAKRLKAKKAAVIAYGVAASNGACEAAANGMQKAGIDVAYQDEDVTYGVSVAPDVQRMQAAGINYVLSCMDINGNISMARAIKQFGMKGVTQLWLDGADLSAIKQYKSLMQGVYFSVAHVPFDAANKWPGVYPGLDTYIKTMNKYYPQYTYDDVAIQGWESAALFVAGLQAAGRNLTQKSLVDATNAFTKYTAGGLTPVVNWATEGHTPPLQWPRCAAYVQVEGTILVPRFTKGHQVFNCVDDSATSPKLVTPPAGTPGHRSRRELRVRRQMTTGTNWWESASVSDIRPQLR